MQITFDLPKEVDNALEKHRVGYSSTGQKTEPKVEQKKKKGKICWSSGSVAMFGCSGISIDLCLGLSPKTKTKANTINTMKPWTTHMRRHHQGMYTPHPPPQPTPLTQARALYSFIPLYHFVTCKHFPLVLFLCLHLLLHVLIVFPLPGSTITSLLSPASETNLMALTFEVRFCCYIVFFAITNCLELFILCIDC